MMRNLVLIAICAVCSIYISSCSKTYSCECNIVEGNETTTTAFSLDGYSGDSAVDQCDSKERFTTDSVDIECVLR